MKCESDLGGRFLGNCERKATVVVEGKGYCWQHDPERMRRDRKGRQAKYKADLKIREAEIEERCLRRRLVIDSGIDVLSNADLQEIIGRGGIKAMLKP